MPTTSSVAISVIYVVLIESISVTSFCPQLPVVVSPKLAIPSQQPLEQPLCLHLDQAQELEAAASDFFSQNKYGDEDDSDEYHDDTKHKKESPLSAASAVSSSSLKEKGSWSKTFFGFIAHRRG